jgi:acyl-CoA thioesterase FadM
VPGEKNAARNAVQAAVEQECHSWLQLYHILCPTLATFTIWVIRQQTIVYLAPLTYGDIVEATTWVSDMRRVRSYREYELRIASDGRFVAVAQADWVYINATTFFPHRIPAEAFEAFQPNGHRALGPAPPLEPNEPVEGRVFVHPHRVKSYGLDNLGHANKDNSLFV